MPITALIWKELRSSSFVVGCSAVVYLFWWLGITGLGSMRFHFGTISETCELTEPEGIWPYLVLTGGFTTALGMSVTRSDSQGNLWQFALFRPLNRRTYLLTKMAVGCVLSGLVSAVPLVAYFAWAMQPGSLGAPWDWSFVVPAVSAWVWAPVTFLAALLSGLSEARWWWSKFWPMAAVFGAGFVLWFMPIIETGVFQHSTSLIVSGWLVCAASLGTSILNVAEERDFS